MKQFVKFSPAEMKAGVNRVKHAEGLILQLPQTHEGRNTWLINYGHGKQAHALRARMASERNLKVQYCLTTSCYKFMEL